MLALCAATMSAIMFWNVQFESPLAQLQTIFGSFSSSLINNEEKIIDELNSAQGSKEDIRGYYFPDTESVFSLMRPSKTFNDIVNAL